MKVTRDVIYDLLPAYFSGDVSQDTRALVDEFLESDPDFARTTRRFRTLLDRKDAQAESTATAQEKQALERTRSTVQRRSTFLALAVAYALATAFVIAVPMVKGNTAHPMMAVAFGITSAGCGIGWLRARTKLGASDL